MPYQWKIGLIALAVVAAFGTGTYLKGKFEEAAQAKLLRAQIEATAKRQAEVEAVARAAEAALLTERQKSAMLSKKLGGIRASQTHSVCKLDPDVIGLLRDATARPDYPR